MSEKPELTVEVGCSWNQSSLEENPKRMLSQFAEIKDRLKDGVALTIIPYESSNAFSLNSGRVCPYRLAGLFDMIEGANGLGLPFAVPLNGGLGLQRDQHIDVINDPYFAAEKLLFERLNSSSETTGVVNYVTLVRDEIRETIRAFYKNIKVIASCIKFTGGPAREFKGMDEYHHALEAYDYVVPLNQHTTPLFLTQFRDRINKIIAFADLHCGVKDMADCHSHYGRLQPKSFRSRFGLSWRVPDDFTSIPAAADFPSTILCESNNNGMLVNRPDHFRDLVGMGVNKFKIPRYSLSANPEGVERLVRQFLQAKQDRASSFTL